ncbi:hypothetical protein QYE76_008411 [Lolium multiflorum]|uniref:ABC transmembrane type-1 domain-containing protein n=1 Tax=Lolium multiflorum TaxID=4521 RepID=A0AAD8WZY3_LOLMU|nr:hypothetical protein QYE76_008410 [Lolium multiflorum]KAK1691714.1 hypothetical protein QYE76_008411 [Lolium multiflorum]
MQSRWKPPAHRNLGPRWPAHKRSQTSCLSHDGSTTPAYGKYPNSFLCRRTQLTLDVPKLLDKQGGQLLAVALLIFSRTVISDRIASLNGTTVKFVLEQDKAAFIRLVGISVLQSAANSFVAPSLSATSVDVEEHLYRLATNMGITVITSSQRPALIPFHSAELKLIDGEGNWELCEIQH